MTGAERVSAAVAAITKCTSLVAWNNTDTSFSRSVGWSPAWVSLDYGGGVAVLSGGSRAESSFERTPWSLARGPFLHLQGQQCCISLAFIASHVSLQLWTEKVSAL